MKECILSRTDATVPLTGDVAGTPWADAPRVEIDEFPWDVTEERHDTVVRPLYDDDALYLQYVAEDPHSYAETTQLNGPVWEDSCVELFATLEPDRRPHYVNLEVNCVGTVRMGFGPDRHDRDLITPALAEDVRVETSLDGPTKVESPDDDRWWVALTLPFDTLAAFTDVSVAPGSGTVWRGNFHRLGGQTDPQFATWNPVDAPEPDFHRPESFGRLVFE